MSDNYRNDPKVAAIVAKLESGLIDRMEALGLKPRSTRGAEMEASYLAGAARALHEMFPPSDPSVLSSAVPPSWIILPLSGRSVYEALKKK